MFVLYTPHCVNKMQKDIFFSEEGDAWFERNHQAMQSREFGFEEPVINAVAKILRITSNKLPKVLEIGCGEGKRLSWLARNFNLECYGVDPSLKAVAAARQQGVIAHQGTADVLPYDSGVFDVAIFGFCLYLCDREDLFRIAYEADRVLKSDAWIVIQDFFSEKSVRREYHHKPGLYSYKMDYRSLFDWHPSYTCYSHEVVHHSVHHFSDDSQEWVAISVLRKKY